MHSFHHLGLFHVCDELVKGGIGFTDCTKHGGTAAGHVVEQPGRTATAVVIPD